MLAVEDNKINVGTRLQMKTNPVLTVGAFVKTNGVVNCKSKLISNA